MEIDLVATALLKNVEIKPELLVFIKSPRRYMYLSVRNIGFLVVACCHLRPWCPLYKLQYKMQKGGIGLMFDSPKHNHDTL